MCMNSQKRVVAAVMDKIRKMNEKVTSSNKNYYLMLVSQDYPGSEYDLDDLVKEMEQEQFDINVFLQDASLYCKELVDIEKEMQVTVL